LAQLKRYKFTTTGDVIGVGGHGREGRYVMVVEAHRPGGESIYRGCVYRLISLGAYMVTP